MELTKQDMIKIEEKLITIDDKLSKLVTKEAVQEYRLRQLEKTQGGAIKISIAAIMASIGALAKILFTKLGGL